MSKDLTTRSNIAPREPMPTPLMVTQRQDKSVTLKFTTQAEADAAWRILSALAEAHADREWQAREARGELTDNDKFFESHSKKARLAKE